MRSVIKSAITVMLASALLLAFAACNNGTSKQNEGSDSNKPTSANVNPPKTPSSTLRPDIAAVTYTIDATAAYASGKLPSDVMSKLDNNGLLVNKAGVTLPKDSAISSPFDVFKKVYGVEASFSSAGEVTFQGISNGSCGDNSRWVLRINGNEVSGPYESVTVSSGDEVIWIFVID